MGDVVVANTAIIILVVGVAIGRVHIVVETAKVGTIIPALAPSVGELCLEALAETAIDPNLQGVIPRSGRRNKVGECAQVRVHPAERDDRAAGRVETTIRAAGVD